LEHYKAGTVGHPLPNVECKIAADGELLVRGPSIFKGYWKMPDETTQSFEDGWFHTGDIGNIDADGYLSITDRKKDLIKTSGGKFVAPQPIENKLKVNALIAQAAILGEKRKFVSVLIAPHFPLLEDWAHANGVQFTDRTSLIASDKVRALYEDIVADVNRPMAQFERLKTVLLVPDEFTIESGELTPSLKLKRRVVEQKYAAQIDAMYQEAEKHHHHEEH
jgi:long-chain acyl-CoA synthetase